jgi:hypothetical protein
MSSQIQVRRGPAVNWVIKNPILASGELGYETDTGKFKIGNGLDSWSARPYFVDEDVTASLIAAAIAGLPSSPDARIGNMPDLTTTNKSTVVEAINEVNTPPINLTVLYANAKAG